MKIGLAVRPGRRIEKKGRTEQDSQKKSQCGNISPIWEEAPTAPIETKICVVGHLADVITYAQFQDDIFRGYDFTGGRISHFPIAFCMGLTTVQRDCAACDPLTYMDGEYVDFMTLTFDFLINQ